MVRARRPARPREHPAVARRGDAGITLIEVMVAMSVGAVVLAIALGGLVQMNRTSRLTAAAAGAQAAAATAFDRLDGELRYAAEVRVRSTPVAGVATPVLEYLTTAVDPAACHRLWVADGVLWRRYAVLADRPAEPATALASGVAPIAGAAPFRVIDTGDDTPNGVAVALSTAVSGDREGAREFRATYAVPNTVRGPDDASLDDCAAKLGAA
ncbi:hypothetical protein GCM10010123_38850 [Pilimelia anulata]|uniref:Prepilin-type N-terminal cleavage/methylation domain-containing protein n=1 Tax=Pilimelia anulata TaxID=53371 RepID=A0A8J3BEP7_9ACTN|nr:prepilin-type N-terminal cleavage/methylation domain-containing protein [Pilimelia anulata]GGK05248.1 hypothetical protein GCM10010123_38850 [Pilimelia anulata]